MAVTDANPDSFRRMDESTAEQWAHIGARTFENQGRVADRMIMLLESLAEISDGFITDQLTHCLQTATMAEKAGADEEMIFGALMHDVGKAISVPNHGAISAEMIKPYVRDDVYKAILNHQDFQGKHYYGHFGARSALYEVRPDRVVVGAVCRVHRRLGSAGLRPRRRDVPARAFRAPDPQGHRHDQAGPRRLTHAERFVLTASAV